MIYAILFTITFISTYFFCQSIRVERIKEYNIKLDRELYDLVR